MRGAFFFILQCWLLNASLTIRSWPVLSRFDMIFLVRDIREEERDRLICKHVMGVHFEHSSTAGDVRPGDFTEDTT